MKPLLSNRGHGGPMGPAWLATLFKFRGLQPLKSGFDGHEAMSNVFLPQPQNCGSGEGESTLFKREKVSTAFSAGFHIYIF